MTKRGKYLIHKGQCLSVCLSVLYRNPNGWTDRDEIWHRGGPRGGGKVLESQYFF